MVFDRTEQIRKRRAANAARDERLRNWHKWFAWYPISVDDGVIVWLEHVERKGRTRILEKLQGRIWLWEHRRV